MSCSIKQLLAHFHCYVTHGSTFSISLRHDPIRLLAKLLNQRGGETRSPSLDPPPILPLPLRHKSSRPSNDDGVDHSDVIPLHNDFLETGFCWHNYTLSPSGEKKNWMHDPNYMSIKSLLANPHPIWPVLMNHVIANFRTLIFWYKLWCLVTWNVLNACEQKSKIVPRLATAACWSSDYVCVAI